MSHTPKILTKVPSDFVATERRVNVRRYDLTVLKQAIDSGRVVIIPLSLNKNESQEDSSKIGRQTAWVYCRKIGAKVTFGKIKDKLVCVFTKKEVVPKPTVNNETKDED